MCSLTTRIKVKISKRKITGKVPNIWKQNNTVLNNPRLKEEVLKEIFKELK